MITEKTPEDLERTWAAVDDYINDFVIPPDSALTAAVADSQAAGLPPIAVTPSQGKLLYLLAKIRGARQILEIGTLGGYSTIWLARALPPEGRVITLEASPKHAAVARANLTRAGLMEKVEIREGAALETLPELAAEGLEPFDFVFIDADKENNMGYFQWALRLTRPGSLIFVDNVVREGKVVDPNSGNAEVRGARRLNDLLKKETRVSATTIQTVGSKGYDGFTLALVLN